MLMTVKDGNGRNSQWTDNHQKGWQHQVSYDTDPELGLKIYTAMNLTSKRGVAASWSIKKDLPKNGLPGIPWDRKIHRKTR